MLCIYPRRPAGSRPPQRTARQQADWLAGQHTILYFTILYYSIQYNTVLYCTILYYNTILYYTIITCGLPRQLPSLATANLIIKILDFRGFDSSRILILRGGILTSIGDFLESLRQAILAGIILVRRLAVLTGCLALRSPRAASAALHSLAASSLYRLHRLRRLRRLHGLPGCAAT